MNSGNSSVYNQKENDKNHDIVQNQKDPSNGRVNNLGTKRYRNKKRQNKNHDADTQQPANNPIAQLRQLKPIVIFQVESKNQDTNSLFYKASVDVDGQKFIGEGITKNIAQNRAASAAVGYLTKSNDNISNQAYISTKSNRGKCNMARPKSDNCIVKLDQQELDPQLSKSSNYKTSVAYNEETKTVSSFNNKPEPDNCTHNRDIRKLSHIEAALEVLYSLPEYFNEVSLKAEDQNENIPIKDNDVCNSKIFTLQSTYLKNRSRIAPPPQPLTKPELNVETEIKIKNHLEAALEVLYSSKEYIKEMSQGS